MVKFKFSRNYVTSPPEEYLFLNYIDVGEGYDCIDKHPVVNILCIY